MLHDFKRVIIGGDIAGNPCLMDSQERQIAHFLLLFFSMLQPPGDHDDFFSSKNYCLPDQRLYSVRATTMVAFRDLLAIY